VWENKNIFMNTNILIFNSKVKWVLVYGCETWEVTAQITDKLRKFVNGRL
jgi:hypothetical protein